MRHEQTYRQPNERWPRPKGRWLDSARLSRLLPAVLILMVALCCSSCATTRKNRTEEKRTEAVLQNRDSAATATRLIRKEGVPESRAEMTIAVDSLLRLPADASYSQHSGQATATVTRKGETIYVAATCDSLEREVEYYEELYYRATEALEQYENDVQTQKEQRSDPLANPIVNFLIGIVGGVIITVFTIIVKRNNDSK